MVYERKGDKIKSNFWYGFKDKNIIERKELSMAIQYPHLPFK